MTQDARAFNWDSIPLKSTTSPAAGTNFTYTVPAGKIAVLYGIGAKFVSSGTAHTHVTRFDVLRGAGNYLYSTASSSTQAATLTNYYYYWAGLAVSDANDQVVRTWPFPNRIDLKAGDIINSAISNISDTDQLTVFLNLKESPIV